MIVDYRDRKNMMMMITRFMSLSEKRMRWNQNLPQQQHPRFTESIGSHHPIIIKNNYATKSNNNDQLRYDDVSDDKQTLSQNNHFIKVTNHKTEADATTTSQSVPDYYHPKSIHETNQLRKNQSYKIDAKTVVVNPERHDATKLVDQLLDDIKQKYMNDNAMIMMNEKSSHSDHPKQLAEEIHCQHTIAYSGGVDSSLVAALLYQCNGGNVNYSKVDDSWNNHKGDGIRYDYTIKSHVQAVMGISPAVPQEQIALAEKVAQSIGINFLMIPTHEGSDDMYISNDGQACYACKTHLYSTLRAISNHQQHTHVGIMSSSNHLHNIQRPHSHHSEEVLRTFSSMATDDDNSSMMNHLLLYNGTNADDMKDATRVGLIAAKEFHVVSPLVRLTKEQIRIVAKHLQLPNWNYASNPCLRSRIQYGVLATSNHLHRIELAERHVRETIIQSYKLIQQQQQNEEQHSSSLTTPFLNEATNLRVRLLSHNRACIEIDQVHVDIASSIDWNDHFIKHLQFDSVLIRPFKSGSVAKK